MNEASDAVTHHLSSAELAIAVKAEPPERLQSLERAFWEWLATPNVPKENLLELVRTGWLQVSDLSGEGAGQKTLSSPYRDGEPYEWVLQCLPAAENPALPLFRRVLAGRLGQVFALIAADKSVRSSLRLRDWTSLFDFAHRVCIPDALAAGVMRLQATFDAEGTLPYPPDSVRAQNFIRLLARVQPDNSFLDRWLAALSAEPGLEEQANPVMPASLTEAWRGFCLLPQDVPLEVVEKAAGFLCRGIEQRYSSDAVRRTEIERYLSFTTAGTRIRIYLDLALAKLWQNYRWLPLRDPMLFAVATLPELAFLGQLLNALSTVDDPLVSRISAMYDHVAEKLSLHPRAPTHKPDSQPDESDVAAPDRKLIDSFVDASSRYLNSSIAKELQDLRQMVSSMADANGRLSPEEKIRETRLSDLITKIKEWQSPREQTYMKIVHHVHQRLQTVVSG